MSVSSLSASPTVASTATTSLSPAVVTAAANAARGNAAISTGYSSTPATTSVGASTATSIRTAAVQASTGVPIASTTNGVLKVNGSAVTNAQQGVAALNTVGSFVTATAGAPQSTGVQHDVKDAISALAAFAQGKMDNVKANIQALMNSEGGEMNAAKLQAYSNELSTFESMMQMAAKMQEQQDQAIKIWVRP